MTAHITINDREFQKRIKEILKNLDDRRSFFAQAVVAADKMIQENFEKEGKILQDGAKWADLAPSTKLARQKGWGEYIASEDFKILQNTGQLKSQWKHLWTARFGKIQSGKIYGTTLHYGDKKRNIPARPILPDEKHLMPKLMKILSLWVKGVFKK